MGFFDRRDFLKEMDEYEAYASSMRELGKDPITGEDLDQDTGVEDLLDAMGYNDSDTDVSDSDDFWD